MGRESIPKHFPADLRKGPPSTFFEDLSVFEDLDEISVNDWSITKHYLENLGIKIPTDAKILELGSGKGLGLKDMENQNINAVGVDARPRGSKNLRQVAARIEQLPFADNSFDVIYSHGVFDNNIYEQDQDTMIAEAARVLKSGGVFIGRNPNDITDKMPALFQRVPGYLGDNQPVYRKI